MTTTQEATPSLDKEGVFAAQNPQAVQAGLAAGYAVPFISEEAKFAAAQAQRAATFTKTVPAAKLTP